MNSYTGLHARVYDEIYAEKPYAEEARFVHELAGAPGGKLLDVACGTGRHALAFADLGYEVTATDINDELLDAGRAAAGDRVRFVQGDMCRPRRARRAVRPRHVPVRLDRLRRRTTTASSLPSGRSAGT